MLIPTSLLNSKHFVCLLFVVYYSILASYEHFINILIYCYCNSILMMSREQRLITKEHTVMHTNLIMLLYIPVL